MNHDVTAVACCWWAHTGSSEDDIAASDDDQELAATAAADGARYRSSAKQQKQQKQGKRAWPSSGSVFAVADNYQSYFEEFDKAARSAAHKAGSGSVTAGNDASGDAVAAGSKRHHRQAQRHRGHGSKRQKQ